MHRGVLVGADPELPWQGPSVDWASLFQFNLWTLPLSSESAKCGFLTQKNIASLALSTEACLSLGVWLKIRETHPSSSCYESWGSLWRLQLALGVEITKHSENSTHKLSLKLKVSRPLKLWKEIN